MIAGTSSVVTSSAQINPGVIVDSDVSASAAIAWSKVSKTASSLADLATRAATDLSGVLLPANGGTGVASPTAKGLVRAQGASVMDTIAPGSAGQVVVSDGTDWGAGSAPASLSITEVADHNLTGTATETELFTANLPAGAMGINGMVRITVVWNAANDGGGAGSQNLRIKFGGTEICGHSRTGGQGQISVVEIQNDASASVQQARHHWWKNDGAASGFDFGVEIPSTINTANAVAISVTGDLSNTAHHIEMNSISVECFNKS